MASFKKMHVMNTLLSTKLVPIFYHQDVEIAKEVVKACYKGGVRIFEFTNRGDYAPEVFAVLIRWVKEECPEMIIGIGTILDEPTAAMYLQAGANFIVGPTFNPLIARLCNRRMIPYVPGCGSVTEVSEAQSYGCDIIKVFPAGNVGGPSFVKNIKGPLPWSILMATGGVELSEESISSWVKSGVDCIGLGSNLFPKEVIDSKNWNKISENCKFAIDCLNG